MRTREDRLEQIAARLEGGHGILLPRARVLAYDDQIDIVHRCESRVPAGRSGKEVALPFRQRGERRESFRIALARVRLLFIAKFQ